MSMITSKIFSLVDPSKTPKSSYLDKKKIFSPDKKVHSLYIKGYNMEKMIS